jgi:hypothetical protein
MKRLVLVSLFVFAATAAMADVQPGDVITKDNVSKASHLMGPGIKWCVDHGMTMDIVPYKKVEWPRAFKEATEKYGGQAKLSDDRMNLESYTAGLPFPNLDLNDPNVAMKIMWNYQYKPLITDDVLARDFQVPSGSLTFTGPMTVEREFTIGDLRRLYYNGRVVQDPKPELPNPEQIRYKEILSPIVSPYDMKGVGELTNRYLSAARQDDTWLYIPAVRRVRRMASAQRSDALFGQDADQDSYWGYSGHIAWSDWKLLGMREILGPVHRKHFRVQRCPDGADFVYCDNWEKRKVYVLEGNSKLPQYTYGKRILYIDAEAWVVLMSDIYDKSGELWKEWIEFYWYQKGAPGGTITYEDDTGFTSAVMIDMQLNHATVIMIPGPASPDPNTWYYNQGPKAASPYAPGNTEDVFTVSHLIAGGS